jgi:membrane protease subunit HflC
MKPGLLTSIAVALATLLIAAQSFFVVDEREVAIVLQLGEVSRVARESGMQLKLPFIQSVRFYDKRILTLEAETPQRFLAGDKTPLMVDYFVKWRIVEPRQYYVSVGGDERQAATRLKQAINDALRAEFGKLTTKAVVSGERDAITNALRGKAESDGRRFGAQIVDVRISRVDFPDSVRDNTYRQMEKEREQYANELRSQGDAEKEKIRADADKRKTIILAESYRKAQKIRGEGDAKAAAIYAQAYSQNAEFYAFYKSLEAYRQTFKSRSDVMVMDPSSEFFRYMRSAGKAAK